MKNSVYYAHHLYKYNTKVEEYELEVIKKRLPTLEIINSNGDVFHEDLSDENNIIDKCFDAIAKPGVIALVFSSVGGVVSKNVYDEVFKAKELNRIIYYLDKNILTLCNKLEFKIINESNLVYAIINNAY